jgi:hypothetical protein
VVSDDQRHTVVAFNPDGSLAHIVGEPGQGNGSFRNPKGLSTSVDGKLLVADANNHRVQAFEQLGKIFKAKWQAHKHEIKKGRQVGEFQNPGGATWSTPATEVEVTRNAAAIGFEVSDAWKTDGLDYGSDDDYEEQQAEAAPAATITKTKQPDLIVADTGNNRIQYVPSEGSAGFEELPQLTPLRVQVYPGRGHAPPAGVRAPGRQVRRAAGAGTIQRT